MLTWTQAEEKFTEILPGFQSRPNQHALALQAERSFQEHNHLLAQAGCGTGKSFVAAVVGVQQARKSKKPTILATATKALQDQYAAKDLPFLSENLEPFNFAVLKGRSNYVCRARVDELTDSVAKKAVTEIIEADDFSGEILDVSTGTNYEDSVLRAQLSMSSDECPGRKDCPFGDVCFAEAAKDKARLADLIVVNHAVLAADTAIKAEQTLMGIPEHAQSSLLPQFGGVIVDEAHELEEFVTGALGGEATSGTYHRLGKIVADFLTDRNVAVKVDALTSDIYNLVTAELAKRQDTRTSTLPVTQALLSDLSKPIVALVEELRRLEGVVSTTKIHGDDKAEQKRKRIVRRLQNAVNRLGAIVIAESTDLVRWLEVGEGRKGDSICWAPLKVADFLRDHLWSKAPAMGMSATLALGTDFSFIAERIGMDNPDTFDAGTPFDFSKQAMTFVPPIAAPVSTTMGQYRGSSIAITKDLVRASNGRALLLFTSKSGMNEAYDAIAPMITKMGHVALKQGDESNKILAAKFASDEHSVLFALKSFFTGMDIQGDSLRLVVIDKLPFPVPTDVIFKARTDALDDQYGKMAGFNKLSVPTMALTILQGYGRLIRTVNDKGLVAILDSRLIDTPSAKAKGYGKRIMGALPNAPVVTSLAQATEYLENLEEVA